MSHEPVNLYADILQPAAVESFDALLVRPNVRIERIVSHGHASPPDFWYDQAEHEWVAVLRGAARLRFAADERTIELRPGDCVDIPAHTKHRVDWTTPDEPTVWLAVFSP